jgi:hypothetical protein
MRLGIALVLAAFGALTVEDRQSGQRPVPIGRAVNSSRLLVANY